MLIMPLKESNTVLKADIDAYNTENDDRYVNNGKNWGTTLSQSLACVLGFLWDYLQIQVWKMINGKIWT